MAMALARIAWRSTEAPPAADEVRAAIEAWLWEVAPGLRRAVSGASADVAAAGGHGGGRAWAGRRETNTMLSSAEWQARAAVHQVRVPAEVVDQVEELAAVLGASRSSLVRAALAWYRARNAGPTGDPRQLPLV